MSNLPVSISVLNNIKEKTDASTGMYVQELYKDTLKFLIEKFNDVYYLDKNKNPIKVKCYHSNLERAIAKKFQGENITLPVITIEEIQSNPSVDRQRYSNILVHEKFWDDLTNRSLRILSLPARPVDISYNINIWSKYRNDLDQIREYIFNIFNPDLIIKTSKLKNTKCFISSENLISQITADDLEDRILKKSIEISVESYIPSPRFLYTSTGKIEEFNLDVKIDS